ncbi:hypothetical protein RGQ15_07145 [Paracoccus sp. MBLB3053]|uniref:Gene transfer agent family protein n=1 Tax=Paracoccus aurantius TaxID=3073814 RepID=A0ABU2HRW3_9RHOB|nr:hypothetical protein [Paracoccus sp. MBLB3053]MDS9467349.1 hypothetical protein [Paracoccus sp. MBLB3053]
MNLQGTISLSHDGRAYAMTLDMNALCTFEEVTGKNGFAMLKLLECGGIQAGLVTARDLRALFYGGLRSHQPEITPELAGQILDANAGLLVAAVQAASPQEGDLPQEEKAVGKPHRPRKKRAS